MKPSMLKPLKWITGLLLLPCCAAVTLAVFDLARLLNIRTPHDVSHAGWGLVIGFVFWLFLYLVMPRPMRSYVVAHELSHVVLAWMMGSKVSEIKVREDSGHVIMDRTNFVIMLAPYFLPFYTICITLVHLVLSLFYDQSDYAPFWLGLVGFTWAYHLTFTISTLRTRQSDIQANGRLFSYTFIYLMNLLGIGLWIVITAKPTLEQFANTLQERFLWTMSLLSGLADPLRVLLSNL